MNKTDGLQHIQQLAFAHIASRVLSAGVFLKVFDVVSDAGNTAEEIAELTQTSLRGIRMLLDTLTTFHLLRKSSGKYFLNDVSNEYLRKESPGYMGHLWEQAGYMEPWNHLVDSIKNGKRWTEEINPDAKDRSFGLLVRSLHVVNANSAHKAAGYFTSGFSRLKVLDVACGSGIWGAAIAMKDSESQIVAQDFSDILKITKRYAEQFHVENQFSFLPGNLREINLGENLYDLVILGNIFHYEGEIFSKDLLRRVNKALKKNGRVAIIDLIANAERTAPQSVVAFALVMLLDTAEGDVYTMQQYNDWLHETGFHGSEAVDIGAPSPMLIGHK